MLGDAQKLAIILGFVPYLALASYDGWLHEKARRVPKPEQALHALLFISVLVLMLGLFRQQAPLFWAALAVFTLAGCADEFGFHGQLHARERRLHHWAYASFAGFLGVVALAGALP